MQPVTGNFDFKHLCSIHQHIFQDLYHWAGCPRTVDIARGNSLFFPAWNIYGYAEDIFPKYYKNCIDAEENMSQFVRVFAGHYADLNALHPFREGNGRSQMEFCRELCLKCGYALNLTHTCRDEMLQASVVSLEKGDNTLPESIFQKFITAFHLIQFTLF